MFKTVTHIDTVKTPKTEYDYWLAVMNDYKAKIVAIDGKRIPVK